MRQRVLTGINTTGTLHLGNYCGAIRPCIEASRKAEIDSFFFMADLHALIKCQDPERIAISRQQIAASWLAAGLDPEHVTFYRQSDIPEIPQLNWMLNCVCAKGLMNRAHAYKAQVDVNTAQEQDPDNGVSMGLFCYPVLMAADILMFNANRVPVGRDQIQHLEMARDIATRFNNIYGIHKEFFVMPYEQVDEEMEILPGLDGRKMSKSYNNVMPLFEGGEKALKETIGRIVTDSRLPGEPKDPDSTSLTQIFAAFATHEERDEFRAQLVDGLGWGEAKAKLFEQVNREIGPMRDRYDYYMQHPDELEDILQAGAKKARAISEPFMEELRHAVGLRTFRTITPQQTKTTKIASHNVIPAFKQYREADNLFYFKLIEGDKILLQSIGFANGRDAGMLVAQLKREGFTSDFADRVHLGENIDADTVNAALATLRQIDEEKAKAKAQKNQ